MIWGFKVGVGDQYALQAIFQRQILKSECHLKSNCSTPFLASSCLCCLFTFWQSLSLFCHFQPSHFISTYTVFSCGNGVQASEAVCWLLFCRSPSPLPAQRSFAMPFHPHPSYCRVSFELFKSGLGYCSVLFTTSTKHCLWFAWLVKRMRGLSDWENGTWVIVTGFNAPGEQKSCSLMCWSYNGKMLLSLVIGRNHSTYQYFSDEYPFLSSPNYYVHCMLHSGRYFRYFSALCCCDISSLNETDCRWQSLFQVLNVLPNISHTESYCTFAAVDI